MDSTISATLSHGYPDNQGNLAYNLKIQGRNWEMNVLMTKTELALVQNVKAARWSERTSLRIGTCAGVQTFWSCEDGLLSILLGNDDETWDFGVTIPEAELDIIIAEIERGA